MKILEKILNDKINRKELIKEFQSQIWNNAEAPEVLKDLAYDLDFYEPNEVLRMEDPSYYGDERLEKEVLTAIQKLDSIR
jgi:hypothetical protein